MDTYDFPMAFRGIAFNAHRQSDGTLIPNTNENNLFRVNAFDFSKLQQRDQREALHLLSGGDLGDATLVFRYLSISGLIKAPNGMLLDDKIAQLMAAFDVEEAQRASPSTSGVTALTFTGMSTVNNGRGTATTDAHGNAGFYVPEQFLARPAAEAIITGRRSGGDSATFACELVCADRRRYCQTAEAVALNAGNGYSATCPDWDASMGIAVAPVLTIVMAGAGNVALTITLNGLSLVLNMSLETAGTFTVDCATGIIKKGSTHRADLRTSAVTTPFLLVPKGGAVLSAANTTNVTSITAAYSQARG